MCTAACVSLLPGEGPTGTLPPSNTLVMGTGHATGKLARALTRIAGPTGGVRTLLIRPFVQCQDSLPVCELRRELVATVAASRVVLPPASGAPPQSHSNYYQPPSNIPLPTPKEKLTFF